MATIREKYTEVEQTWPGRIAASGRPLDLPTLTAHEAVLAAKRLYRFAMRQTFTGKVKVTSGNRYTWVRNGVMSVNPSQGWGQLVHMLSHYAHNRIGDDKPHSKQHARLEARMIKEVVSRGWLTGALMSEPEPTLTDSDRAQNKLSGIDARIDRWESKLNRAENAIKKLNRQRKYYAAKL